MMIYVRTLSIAAVFAMASSVHAAEPKRTTVPGVPGLVVSPATAAVPPVAPVNPVPQAVIPPTQTAIMPTAPVIMPTDPVKIQQSQGDAIPGATLPPQSDVVPAATLPQ